MSREKRDIIPRKKKKEKREIRFLERRKSTISKRFRLHSSQDRPYSKISYNKRAQISRQRMGAFPEADWRTLSAEIRTSSYLTSGTFPEVKSVAVISDRLYIISQFYGTNSHKNQSVVFLHVWAVFAFILCRHESQERLAETEISSICISEFVEMEISENFEL